MEWVAAQKLDVDIAIGTVECVGTGGLKVPPCNDLSMMDLFRNHPPHQAAFIRRALFEKGGFDESLVLVADWSFFVDRLIFQHTSYRRLDKIISDYDMSGLSTMQTDLLREERYRVLKAFFPERVLKDYEKYKYADSPLLELIPELNRTAGFHRMVYRLVKFLLRCYHWIG